LRILQINSVYKFGSTGKIVFDIHAQLKNAGYDSFIIYGRGKFSSEPNVFKTSPGWDGKLQALYGRISGNFYGGALYSTYKLINKIKKISPDIVHVHCMNGNYVNNYLLLSFLAENNYKTIITLHAEITYTGICGHAFDCEKWLNGCGKCPQIYKDYHSWFFDRTSQEWARKAKAFARFKDLKIVSVSQWLEERAKQSPMFTGRSFDVIGNGLDTSIFHHVETGTLKEKLGIGNEKIILYVTPSFKHAAKGGKYVIEVANRLLLENVKIIIVGFDGYDGVLPSNVIPITHTESQQEMAQYYSLANITILTSKRETFSMVCAESLSCGTPVIGFKAGAPEQISLSEFSEFVEQGDIDSLVKITKKWLKKKKEVENIELLASNQYSKQKMGDEYIRLYEKMKLQF